jgi:hypothetical protein
MLRDYALLKNLIPPATGINDLTPGKYRYLYNRLVQDTPPELIRLVERMLARAKNL